LREEILRTRTGNFAFSAEGLEVFNNLCDGGMHPREALRQAKLTLWVKSNGEVRAQMQEYENARRKPRKKVSYLK
jgi:hypothetical protein